LTALLHLKSLVPFAAEWWYTFPGIIKPIILDRPIENLGFSGGLEQYLRLREILSLEAIVKKSWREWRALSGFDYILFNELVRFLDSENLVHFLDQPES